MKKIFVAIIALAVLCNLAAATWNTSQYDDILNDARRMDEIEYTRQRQAVLDKRAAQDYALKREADLRRAEREKAEHELYMRELRARQRQAQPYGSTSSSSYRKPRSGTYDNTRYNSHPYTETRTGSHGQTYYVGPKSGEYYVNKNGNRTYYTKVPETQPVYTGPQGGSYNYTTSGKKRYIRSK